MTDDLTIHPASSRCASLGMTRAKWREAIARHELVIFFLLAFLLSWYPWFLAIARGRTSGPNPLGPFLAALIVTGLVEGWSGIRALLGRIVRVRIGLRWYGVIFGLPVVLCALAFAIMAALGHATAAPDAAAWRELPDRFLFIFLFIGLGEEPGWRGFALPRLQRQHSPLIASLILAPLWALWHLPLMGNEFPPAVIPAFLISLLGGTIIQTWLFNRTKGSVFAQMLFHATVNTVGAGLIFPLFEGASFTLFWYIYTLLWLAAALVISALRRGGFEPPASQVGPAVAGEIAPPFELGISAVLSGEAEADSASQQNAGRRAPHPKPDRI
jgi:membrane protease YdiL (CAAX protease family)